MRVFVTILFSLVCLMSFARPAKSKEVALTDTERQRFLYYFYEAKRCYEVGEYDRAMALYLFAEQLNPEDAAVQNALGTLYHGLHNSKESLRHFAKAYTIEPQVYWEHYAGALYGNEEYAAAERVLQQVYKQLPRSTDVIEALTNVYVQQKKHKKALQVQNKLIQIEGLNAYNTMGRYRIFLLQNKPEKAVGVVQTYLDATPEDYRMQTFLGDIYLSTGETDKALNVYLAEQKRHPDNPYNYLSLGKLYQQKGNYNEAGEAIVNAILCEDLDISDKLRTIRTNADLIQRTEGLLEQTLATLIQEYPLEEELYWTLSVTHLYNKRYTQAQKVAQTLIDINPKNAKGWDIQLDILQADTTATDSNYMPVVRGAYEQFPTDPKWCYYMGTMLLIDEQMDSAIVVSKAGLLPSESKDRLTYQQATRVRLGDIYSAKGQLDSAYFYYEEVLRLDPENIYTLNNYAYLLATHGGDLRKAEKMSQITIQKEPDNATYLDTYAWILHLQGVDSLAKFYIKKALDNIGDMVGREEIVEHYNAIFKE